MSEIEINADGTSSVVMLNETEISNSDVANALLQQHPEIAALTSWARDTHSRAGGLFERDIYVVPDKIFEQFRAAKYAADTDDIVSNVLESTESLAFSRVSIECEDKDEENVWNQIAQAIDLESRVKEIWREYFIYSNAYVTTWMSTQTYKVSGRKKQYRINVPTGISVLNPMKVVPVGNFMFNQERLAYLASSSEAEAIEKTLKGTDVDLLFSELIEGPYAISPTERSELGDELSKGFFSAVQKIYLLKAQRSFRITATRPQYERLARVRMQSIFELLDLKAQLRQMDRAHLIGGTSFIILVKKGSDELPAQSGELQQLATQVKSTARVPIIIGDHRLSIEIITPKLDKTLSPERYNGIDSRIASRMYGLVSTGNYASGTANDDSVKLMRIASKALEARRNSIRNAIERHILKPAFEANALLKSEPRLVFHPRRISLDFDPNIAVFMQDLRDRGEISRETILDVVDLEEGAEARKREFEAEEYDSIFSPVAVPFGNNNNINGDTPSSQPIDTKGPGRRGGGKSGGGGRTRESYRSQPGQGTVPPKR